MIRVITRQYLLEKTGNIDLKNVNIIYKEIDMSRFILGDIKTSNYIEYVDPETGKLDYYIILHKVKIITSLNEQKHRSRDFIDIIGKIGEEIKDEDINKILSDKYDFSNWKLSIDMRSTLYNLDIPIYYFSGIVANVPINDFLIRKNIIPEDSIFFKELYPYRFGLLKLKNEISNEEYTFSFKVDVEMPKYTYTTNEIIARVVLIMNKMDLRTPNYLINNELSTLSSIIENIIYGR